MKLYPNKRKDGAILKPSVDNLFSRLPANCYLTCGKSKSLIEISVPAKILNKQTIRGVFRRYFELTFWTIALILLASMPPGANADYSFCVFKLMGLSFCPGCGLGHSISYLFHGNLSASLSAHPLGIFATVIILLRMYKLIQSPGISKN